MVNIDNVSTNYSTNQNIRDWSKNNPVSNKLDSLVLEENDDALQLIVFPEDNFQ